MDKIRFGPAGNDRSFYEQGYKKSVEAPAWIAGLGLDCYEYSCGNGVSIGEATARQIGKAAQENDIAVSLHAPYYINLCSLDHQKRAGAYRYFWESLQAAEWLNGTRVVFHAGTCAKGSTRAEAFSLLQGEMENLLRVVYKQPQFSSIFLCPETMGKESQLCNVQEVVALCKMDDRLIPALDFGHIHAVAGGGMKTKDDYRRVLDEVGEGLDQWKHDHMHVHFSHIQYGARGEIRHLTFQDRQYGPFFEPLAELFAERKMKPTVICESKEVMAQDALRMKQIFENAVSVLP